MEIPKKGYGYLTRYNNVCQGDPIARIHRTKQAAMEYCARQNGPIENDGYSHSYSVQIWCDGKIVGAVDYRTGEEIDYRDDEYY